MMGRRIELWQSGRLGMLLAGWVVLAFILWQISKSVAGGDFRSALLLGAVFVAFFVVGKIAHDWRRGVYVFFVWLLFEDTVRKYTGNSMAVYFAKDVLAGAVYWSFLAAPAENNREAFKPPFRHALGLFFLVGLVQVFNPLSPSIFYGLLGLKIHFYYVPLMFVGYGLLRKEDDLRRFLVLSMVLAGVISVVGILQSIIGLDFLNPRGGADIDELGHLTRFTSEGIAVLRPPSVFVSDGRFAEYLVIAFIVGVGAAAYLLLRPGRGRNFIFPAVGLVALASALAGGRSAFVFVVASGILLPVGIIWGAPPSLGAAYRLVKAIRRGFVVVALAAVMAVTFFPSATGSHLDFYRETILPDREHSETGARVWDYPVSQIEAALADPHWVMGHGIGTASLGIQYVSRILEVARPQIGAENGYAALDLELGIPGVICWLAWTVSLVIAAWQVVLKLKGTWAFPLGLAITWFAFLLLFPMTWGTIVEYQNYVANAYFWFLVGVLFRLPGLVAEDVNAPRVALAYSR